MEKENKQNRRDFLKKLTLGSAGLLILGGLEGCKPEDPEMRLGSMAELKQNRQVKGEFNENSVLAFINQKDEIVVYSLTCSHKRCTVKWKSGVQQFHCPCHKGKYDAKGFVISGPPPRPLRKYKWEQRGDDIWLLNEFVS